MQALRVNDLPKNVVAPTESFPVPVCSKLRRELPRRQTITFESFLVRQPAPHTTNSEGSVLVTCGGRPHSNLFSRRAGLARH
jgi:hypothetical protein